MLAKLFIKNYQNVDNTKVRNRYGMVAGVFGIITNLFLGCSKLVIGYIANSITIMADAVNNLSDTIASILTLIGFKISDKKPSEIHPYGYARYEYVANLFVSLFVLGIGLLFAQKSFLKIFHPEPINLDLITFIILIIAILIKGLQVYVYLSFAKTIKSETLKSTAADSRNDIITTSTIFVSLIVMAIFHINIDGLIAFIVSLFIIYNAIGLLRNSLNPLIGIKPTPKQVTEISTKLLSYDEVLGIHDLVIHNYGVNYDFVTVHIELNEELTFLKAHQIADLIEEDFYNDLGINITIHMDPVCLNNTIIDDIKAIVLDNLYHLDSEISLHDFRLIKNRETTKILFDCVTPFESDYTAKRITNYLKRKMNPEDKKSKYTFIIKIDKKYV